MKYFIKSFIIVVIIAICVYFYIIKEHSIVFSGPSVIQAIQLEAKLVTVTMNITQDNTIIRKHGIADICSEQVTYIGYFIVSAGVDIKKLTSENIVTSMIGNEKNLIITLPKPEILNNELDVSKSRIIAQQTSWVPGCTHQIADMTIEAQKNVQAMAINTAMQKGIIKLAQERAAVELYTLLQSVGYTHVAIRYAQ